MIYGKVWGTTQKLLDTPCVEVHLLIIVPNARCSLHAHRYKWNAFLVWSGQLEIHVEREAYKLTDVTVLGPGDFTTVAPNEFHRFVTGPQGAHGIELYYPQWLSEDIIRKDVGGLLQARMK